MIQDFSRDIECCLDVLRRGGMILYPTDTVWGIGCDATNDEAVQKIISLKQRPDYKSFVILVSSTEEVRQYITSGVEEAFKYLATVHKPTTIIYEKAVNLSSHVVGPDGSVAIRIAKDDFCKELINLFGKPIVSTSANLSGQATPALYTEIDKTIINSVDYCVQYKQAFTQPAEPSSIVKLENGFPVVLRP